MRPVTLTAAFLLSFFALSLSSPVSASPVERLAKDTAQAAVKPAKKTAAAKQPVKKQAVAKQQKKAAAVKKQARQTAVTSQPARKFVVRQQAQNAYAYASVVEGSHRADISMQESAWQPDSQPAKRASAAKSSGRKMPALFASSDIVTEARRWIGTNPTNMDRLWCARFMNFVLERSGFSGTGSDAARSFASYGHRLPGPQVGAIAVMTRGKNGGHVGVVSGVDSSGNPIVISGNHGRKVGEGTYSRARIVAYVRPI
jgi:uncharacterized protein (TIGR02594 family)